MKKFLYLAIFLINGCVTAPQYVTEAPDKDQIRAAQNEIIRKGNIYTNNLSKEQNIARLERVKNKLEIPSYRLCQALKDEENINCTWNVSYRDEPEINAYATQGEDGNEVVIFMGVLDHTHSDEELAFIVAHEMSHHILNHINDDTGFTMGETIGILAGLVLIGGDGYDESNVSAEDMTDLIGLTKEIGGAFDRPQYSRSQENESDFLAIQILDDANYDLNKAKQGLINIAASVEDTSSYPAFLSSHPSGPQRLASFKESMNPLSRSMLYSKIYSLCLKSERYLQEYYNCNQYLKAPPTLLKTSKQTQKINGNSEKILVDSNLINSIFDWDKVLNSDGQYNWLCKEIKSGQVWSDFNCNGIPQDDDRWPWWNEDLIKKEN